MSRPVTIEVVRTDAEQPWHCRIRAGNGEPWWSTENYKHKRSAYDSARRLVAVFGCSESDGTVYPGCYDDPIIGRIVERDERVAWKRDAT